MIPPTSIELRPLLTSDFKSNTLLSETNLAFAYKTKTSGYLYCHALLILTKSSKSKNPVVHDQKFKALLSSTRWISSEKRVLDLEAEVN